MPNQKYKKPEPLDKKLYEKVKKEAQKKFDVWPSIYASSWLVREYKKRGGRYKGSKKKAQEAGLARWFREEWVDVCYWPEKKKSCGRKAASPEKYPYCRPSVRVNSKTPKTVQELTEKQRKDRCRRKRKSPEKKIR